MKINNIYPNLKLSSIIRSIRYIEWSLILGYILIYIINRAPFRYAYQPINSLVIILALICCFGLSFIFPINRPSWQKITYLLVNATLVALMGGMGLGWDVLIYLILAKSCLLLKPKSVFACVIIIGIIWNLILIINIPADIEFTRNNVQSIVASLNDINNTIIRHTVSITASYIPTSIFVVMFSFTIIAERKSRERAEILAKEVESLAATLERTRIARDIHDSLGHTLTTLDVQLELAQRLYIKQSEQASQALDTAKLLSSQCLQDVRRALQTMRSQDFNLNEALQNLVEQVRINQSFSVDVKVNLPPIPLQPSHQIFCIIQEGLTNIQKHAKAEFICLTGNSVVGGVQLELSDDGCGFDINASTSGYGLRGMHERVQMLGGNLTINSSPAIGTKIVVWIPLQ